MKLENAIRYVQDDIYCERGFIANGDYGIDIKAIVLEVDSVEACVNIVLTGESLHNLPFSTVFKEMAGHISYLDDIANDRYSDGIWRKEAEAARLVLLEAKKKVEVA